MNDNTPDIPIILSHAPKPAAPFDLKKTLLAEASITVGRGPNKPRTTYTNQSWVRRWWPVLAPATASLACAVVLTFQQSQVSELKQRLDILAPAATPAPSSIVPQSSNSSSRAVMSARSSNEEIEELRVRSAKLAADIAPLEQLLRENETLRGQIAAASANHLTPDELRAIDYARRGAERIACVNNLKQLGLAIRMWGNDHKDDYPTNLADTLQYAGSTTIYICPADTNRIAAKDIPSFTDANCSYDYYVGTISDPNQVVTLCRIHNNAGLADGSVQQLTPHRLVEKDGKLYIGHRP